jgi:hypothetical protein
MHREDPVSDGAERVPYRVSASRRGSDPVADGRAPQIDVPKPEADGANASVPFGFGDDERVSGTCGCPISLPPQEHPTLPVRVVRRDRCDHRDVGVAAGLSHEGEVLEFLGAHAEGPGSKFGKF